MWIVRASAGRLLLLLVFIADVAGCASDGSIPADRSAARPSTVAEQPANTPPAAVSDALLPPLRIDLPPPEQADEPRFDIKVRSAVARDFFVGLVDGTRYNMVVHPRVSGRIDLDLKNVTVPEVMVAVRDTYGYEFERDGNTYRVLPNELQSRVFHVDYLDILRRGSSQTTSGSAQLSKGPVANTSGTSSATSATIDSGVITTESQSDFWRNLENALTIIVGNSEGRTLSVNRQAGIVMVRAMPAELREVERYLEATRHVSQRQVLLEARILEVELADGFQSGINWASLTPSGKSNLVLGQIGGGRFNQGSDTSAISGTAVNLAPPAGVITTGTATTALGGMFTAAVSGANFSAFIELLEGQGKVQVLSNPRIATLNNQKAVIKVGSDDFFVTDVETNTFATATSTTPNVSVELTPFFSGVSLDVTPQISADGEIILHVRPSVTEVTEQVKDIALTSTNLRMPLASSTIRESDSVIRARDGQIVVIGGLMQKKVRDEQTSVPVLGDLPFVGALFRHKNQSVVKSELVILIKPTIAGAGVPMQGEAESVQQLYERLKAAE